MARLDPSWSDAYVARVARAESELGRFICGAAGDDGNPCREIPVDSGRCRAHITPLSPQPSDSNRTRTVLLYGAVIVIAILTLVATVLSVRRSPDERLWNEATRFLAEGKAENADLLYDMIIREYPTSPYAVEARKILGIRRRIPVSGSARSSTDVVERRYNEARNFYLSNSLRDKERAAEMMIALADSFPQDPRAADAVYDAAILYNVIGSIQREIIAWDRLIRDYPTDWRIPEALYALGIVYAGQMGNREEGARYLRALVERYQGTSAAEAAAMLLSQLEGTISTDVTSESVLPDRYEEPSIYTTPGGR